MKICYCVSNMVFAQKKDNYHIQILKIAPTPSASLNIPEYMNMQFHFI